MMKKLVILLLALTSCSLFKSNENYPDIPGKLVFSAKDDGGTSQIFTMNANGPDLRKLTNFGPEGGAGNPSWSPDGTQIVFENYTGATTLGPYLYVMDADGNNMRPLKKRQSESVRALIGSAPAWSPDGTKIAYQVCTNCELGGSDYEIMVVEVAGEDYDPDQTYAITDHPASDTHPTWSPDGQQIAFVSNREYLKEGGTDIYLTEFEHENIIRVTTTGSAGRQLWSAIGQKLIYWSENNLYKLNLADKQPQLISFNADKETGFRPLALIRNEERILLHVFNYQNPNREESLQVFNSSEKELIPIYSNERFNGADWFIPNEN
ncbi:TolB family protein [Fodinibius salsisoli]|uniref:PD40 domain-containing protein n=1 Tax=Fodinibius salsisoli TaxID=2820877 RepID=A0ABT3PN73_9BACT|nr:hypothetical protein [Fodinibius salsisoli]MCW9707387.1 PD40 domain-containing protein [Fodinibius salsisoli]